VPVKRFIILQNRFQIKFFRSFYSIYFFISIKKIMHHGFD